MRPAKPLLLALALVVALTPFSANTLAALGVRPVGIGETPGNNERRASNLRGVKRLTLSHPNGPNMEELALLNPQLVFSSPTWSKGAKTMRDLDIKVTNADPVDVAGTVSQTTAIGTAVGRKSSAQQLAARLKSQIAGARKGIRKHPRTLLVLGVGGQVLRRVQRGDRIAGEGGEQCVALDRAHRAPRGSWKLDSRTSSYLLSSARAGGAA